MEEDYKKEIAMLIKSKKASRASNCVEKAIQEESRLEALEIIQMFCEALYIKSGLINSTESLDPTLTEAVSTIIWAAPYFEVEVSELKKVSQQLCLKYSKEYGNLCRANNLGTVNQKVIQLLTGKKPSTAKIMGYLQNVAQEFNISMVGFEIVGDSAQPNSSCPYPLSNEHFPESFRTLQSVDGTFPPEALDDLSLEDDDKMLKTGNPDILINSGFGFKTDLWKEDQSPTLRTTTPEPPPRFRGPVMDEMTDSL
ncbi:IST1 homolog [Bufo bufo]|uniref:IST1 homolog n=1 Tax=Bufo bufo TaxID=8384 RepID=UPI001ABE7E3C|nr:IST1 homolog [Bufo bufo]